MKVLKVIASIFCTFVFSISLLALSGYMLVRNIINKDTIMNIIMPSTDEVSYVENTSSVTDTVLAYSEDDLKGMDIDQIQSMANDSGKIHEILDSVFEEKGLPKEIIDYVMNDNEYHETLSEYVNEYINYATGNGEKPKIDQEKVNNILNNNIAKYENDNNQKVNTEKIEEMVSDMSEKIDEEVSNITENEQIKMALKLLSSKKIIIALAINCLIWLVLIILLNLNRVLPFYLGFASLFHGTCYVAIKIILPLLADTESKLQNVIQSIVNVITPKIDMYIALSLVGGALLIASGIVLKITNKKKAE